MRCDTLCSHTIALFGNNAIIQNAKLAQKCNCHLQWQCMIGHDIVIQEEYQWKEDEFLFT